MEQHKGKREGDCGEKEYPVINAGTLQAQPDWNGVLAGFGVRLHIANVVDVEDGNCEEAAGGGRQENGRREHRRLDKVTAEYADPAKEDKHCQITQPGVSVWLPACGVGDCGRDRGSPMPRGS